MNLRSVGRCAPQCVLPHDINRVLPFCLLPLSHSPTVPQLLKRLGPPENPGSLSLSNTHVGVIRTFDWLTIQGACTTVLRIAG